MVSNNGRIVHGVQVQLAGPAAGFVVGQHRILVTVHAGDEQSRRCEVWVGTRREPRPAV